MTLYGIDVSNNNGSGISMAEVAAEGFSFVFAKVCEGNYFQDATWPGYRDAARAAGLLPAGYHYAVASCSPASQVANYQSRVGDLTIPVMIDFEAGSGNIDDYWALVQAFNAAGQRVALTYLPQWYWTQIGSPDLSAVAGLIASNYSNAHGYASAIYAGYGGDNGPGWAPYGNASPVIWQFSNQATIAGNVLDANAFRGDIAQLSALLTGGNMDPDQLILDQLGGPGTGAGAGDGDTAGMWQGWPQLGGRTVVNALGAIGAKLGLEGFTDAGGGAA